MPLIMVYFLYLFSATYERKVSDDDVEFTSNEQSWISA